MHTQFEPAFIDKGAGIFRLKTFEKLRLSFALRYAQQDPTLQNMPVGQERELLDGYLFKHLSEMEGITHVIIRKSLMILQ